MRVKPLAPLSEVVAAALAAEGVAADPVACKLMHGKNLLDLGTPLRFANLPTAAKLELITGAGVTTAVKPTCIRIWAHAGLRQWTQDCSK